MLSPKIVTESLDELQDNLCEELGVDKLKIKIESIKEDAILDINNNCIILSEKTSKDIVETKKAIIHEMRHQYQLYCIALDIKEEPMRKMWALEIKHDIHKYDVEYMNLLYIEIDAYAYTKKYMKDKYDYNLKYSPEYEKIVNKYIKKDLKI